MATKKQFNSFEDMLSSSDVPVLVDFYADWCGPCQIMARELEMVNAELQGQLKIIKIDTEKYPQLASQYQVYALPTLMLFKQGQAVEKIEGALKAKEVVQRVQNFI
ncbi:MAG: thioredoxin [Calothrix sp. MO_192.B10]|nr:thioredoxin [Calothrix sp. MO_192.B10]